MMLTLVLHLPSHRLKISVSRRRPSIGKKAVLNFLKDLRTIRRGSRLSRFFRKLFEQKRIKALFGGNLTLFALVASTIGSPGSALSTITETEPTVLSAEAIELTTRVVVRVPLEQVQITQNFNSFHKGLDLNGETGDPVYSIMKGRVESTVYDRVGYGNHIIINHEAGVKSLYAHLSKIQVSAGDEVETSSEIGRVGSTGRAFGDHLHLEIIDNDRRINPLTILPIK